MDFFSDSPFYIERDSTWDHDDSMGKKNSSVCGDALINGEFKTEAGEVWVLINLYETNFITDTRVSVNSFKT